MKAEPFFAQGFSVQLERGSQHRFCGETELGSCPNCVKPFLKIFELHLGDPLLQGVSQIQSRSIPFLFCWTCEPAERDFSYRLLVHGNRIELLQPTLGMTFDDFPYLDYPQSFGEREARLVPVADEYRRMFKALNEGGDQALRLGRERPEAAIPAHQIGGEPYLVDPDRVIQCPLCSAEMYHLAVFGDETGEDLGFVDNELVQLVYHLCPGCSVLTAFQRCD